MIRRFFLLILAFAWTASVAANDLRASLDAPLLFVKRHAYMSDHIYDDYYTWRPGGGIYVIENPSAPSEEQRIRAVIDADTKETPGVGVYRDPELSWDAKKIVFAFKGGAEGGTSIYEIGIDGRGLRRLTNPEQSCTTPPPVRALGKGRHDISPCYLPDGRIVFTSTRQGGRVPCFNSEVDTLHVMNADGTDIRSISVNNVNEFDPVVLPDGRLLFGRWEYVDKTALYMQSLWTAFPDGSQETAFFGNNMAKPTAFLDARPVPNSHLVVCSLTPHNGQSVGAIAMVDTYLGKNNLKALFNFTPEYPTEMDQGLKKGPCDPWPVSEDLVIISNNGTNRDYAVLEMIDRSGRRELLHSETNISCYSPMLVKPRPVPAVIGSHVDEGEPARFFVQDIYRGLEGVKRGEIARLRVMEETARISGIPPGGRWWNQAFLVSWQGSYTVKNFLGVVPVQPDGSVFFEAPPGRAVYFQALDRDDKMVQSMRTFVQAIPGSTRSCIGCHEYKNDTPDAAAEFRLAHSRTPEKLQPESWGSGYVDYPTMIQPIWDKHCVSCHGGEKGIENGVDLSGGWTWAFNISYETLIKNTLSGFLNCVNEAVKTSQILPPRTHGSGVAPLARVLQTGHGDRIPNLTREERDLVFAWMDGNCNYYGTWNWSENATCNALNSAAQELTAIMTRADCTECHADKIGNDWINLQQPELSRILRAPLAGGGAGHGLGWCRKKKAADPLPLVTLASQPPDVFNPRPASKLDLSGEAVTSFNSTTNEFYQAMLSSIHRARAEALAKPRVDMPGAEIEAGVTRQLRSMPLPDRLPSLRAVVADDGVVELSWERSAETIGLQFEIHRSDEAVFAPTEQTRVNQTGLFTCVDTNAPMGFHHYALVAKSDGFRSQPIRTQVAVPPAAKPRPPLQFRATAVPGEIKIAWHVPPDGRTRFNIYRTDAGSSDFKRLNEMPLRGGHFSDHDVVTSLKYRYRATSVDRRQTESIPTETVEMVALPERREPIFIASFNSDANASFDDGQLKGKVNGKARIEGNALDLRSGGNATFPPQPAFDLRSRFSVSCWVKLAETNRSPVLVSYGRWRENGWFLQKHQNAWRWHLGAVDCDGGEVKADEWTHLLGTFDGKQAQVFTNGKLVATVSGTPNRNPWTKHLYVGQYSGGPGADFQMNGEIKEVKIWHRTLTPKEAMDEYEGGEQTAAVR